MREIKSACLMRNRAVKIIRLISLKFQGNKTVGVKERRQEVVRPVQLPKGKVSEDSCKNGVRWGSIKYKGSLKHLSSILVQSSSL